MAKTEAIRQASAAVTSLQYFGDRQWIYTYKTSGGWSTSTPTDFFQAQLARSRHIAARALVLLGYDADDATGDLYYLTGSVPEMVAAYIAKHPRASPRDAGAAVLAQYDAGRYSLI